MIGTTIDTLCLQGGGSKGLAIIGSLIYLEEQDLIKNFIKYSGSSIGAMICVLLNMGYTPLEMKTEFYNQNNSLIHDSFYKIPFNFIFNYGLYSGNNLVKYIQTLFENKGYNKDITFNELFIKTNKVVVLTGTCLNKRDTFYFNNYTTPQMKVIDALRISISIPLFFTSVQYTFIDHDNNDNDNNVTTNHYRFVDGGLLQNFPYYYFDICETLDKWVFCNKDLMIKTDCVNNLSIKENTLGIMLLNKEDTLDVNSFFNGIDIINNISDFISSLLNCVLDKIEASNFANPLTGAKDNFFDSIIPIKLDIKVNLTDFTLSNDIKNILIETGYNAAIKFFH